MVSADITLFVTNWFAIKDLDATVREHRESGQIITTSGDFWNLGTFPIGSRSYPRIGPHDLGIQIDIIGAFFSVRGPWGDGIL